MSTLFSAKELQQYYIINWYVMKQRRHEYMTVNENRYFTILRGEIQLDWL